MALQGFYVGSEDTSEAKSRYVWGLCDQLTEAFLSKTTVRSRQPLLLEASSWLSLDYAFTYELDLNAHDKAMVGMLENLFHCRPSFHHGRPVQMSRGLQCCETDDDALILTGTISGRADQNVPIMQRVPESDVVLLKAYLTGTDATAMTPIQHLLGRSRPVHDIGIPHRLVRRALRTVWFMLVIRVVNASSTKDVIEAAAWIHNMIVAIHGFIDHNGRFAMALAFVVLRVHGLVPFGYIPGYMEAIEEDMVRSVRVKVSPYIEVCTEHLSAFIEGLQANCSRCLAYPSRDRPHARCGRCGLARYCSKGCQEADWKRHKALCRKLTR